MCPLTYHDVVAQSPCPPPIMTDLIATPTVQLGLAMTILVVVIAVTFWVLGRLHDYTTQDQPQPLGGLSNLEEMLRKGDISEKEFRTITASTRARLTSPGSSETPSAHSIDSASNVSQPGDVSQSGFQESATPVDELNHDKHDNTTS